MMVHVTRPCFGCGKDTAVGLSTDAPTKVVDGQWYHGRCAPKKVDLELAVTQEQVRALVSLLHTVAMWEEFGSDTELHDAMHEHRDLLKPLIDLRDAELRQRTHYLANEVRRS